MSVSQRLIATMVTGTARVQPGTAASAYVMLALVMLFDGFSSSLVRFTLDSGMPPLVIVGLRLPIAWLIFTPLVLRHYADELRRLSRRDIGLIFIAGALFTGQILLVLYAIDNVAIMVVHVTFSTGLLWVATLERVILKTILPRLVVIGLVFAFIGSLIIGIAGAREDNQPAEIVREPVALETGANDESGGNPTLGLLAGLTGSAGGAVYLIIGRKVRTILSSMPYIWGILGSGALISMTALAVSGTPVIGYSSEAYFWLLVLLLVVQFGIHGGINYVVGYLPATFISLSGQLSVLTATIVAFFLFDEIPHWLEIGGGLVIMCGVILALVGQQNNRQNQHPAPVDQGL